MHALTPYENHCKAHGVGDPETALWRVVPKQVPYAADTHILDGHIVRIRSDDGDSVPYVESVFPGWHCPEVCSINRLVPLEQETVDVV